MIDIIWIVWILFVAIIEAIIRVGFKNIYLLMEEDSWKVSYLNRKHRGADDEIQKASKRNIRN